MKQIKELTEERVKLREEVIEARKEAQSDSEVKLRRYTFFGWRLSFLNVTIEEQERMVDKI